MKKLWKTLSKSLLNRQFLGVVIIGIVCGAGAPWTTVPGWAKFDLPPLLYTDVTHRGYDVQADFSKTLKNVSWDRLKRKSVDFNSWPNLKVTGVDEMIVVENYTANHLLVWIKMSTTGATSKHFYDVKVFDEVAGKGTFGNTFELVHPAKSYRDSRGRILPDDPSFSVMEGSWYLQAVPGTTDVSVRYFVDATVQSGIPAFLVGPVAKRSMAVSIRELIEALAQSAQIR